MPKDSAVWLAAKIRRLCEENPSSRCDGCLALHFRASLLEARMAALSVANEPGYKRQEGICSSCNRQLELTSVTLKLRRRKLVAARGSDDRQNSVHCGIDSAAPHVP